MRFVAGSLRLTPRPDASSHWPTRGPASVGLVAAIESAGLTAREREVLQLLSSGLRNKEMAARLSVSERTINFHLTNIYQKLQVSGRTEALSKALEQRLIASP